MLLGWRWNGPSPSIAILSVLRSKYLASMTMTGSRIPLSSLLGKVDETLAAAFYNDMGDTDSRGKGRKAIVDGMGMYRNKANDNGDVETNQEEKAAAQLRDPATTMNLSDAILSKEYHFSYLMFFGNSIAAAAATIIAINGGVNLGGRLFFSSVSDRLGCKNSFFVMLLSQVIILATLPTIMEQRVYYAFLLVIWTLTAF
ncbi:hypothetical protein DFQ27_004859 [Actinomortierella ambigua]|uniref:Uncharacterized protein n=1 Tax=Actinomortierella ambigua TaxID=1343610 RepID=A0A9P6QHM6_9FUNG|nr:hypothetical protein DFQ27_004859 [Actinomortierella ambigua]